MTIARFWLPDDKYTDKQVIQIILHLPATYFVGDGWQIGNAPNLDEAVAVGRSELRIIGYDKKAREYAVRAVRHYLTSTKR